MVESHCFDLSVCSNGRDAPNLSSHDEYGESTHMVQEATTPICTCSWFSSFSCQPARVLRCVLCVLFSCKYLTFCFLRSEHWNLLQALVLSMYLPVCVIVWGWRKQTQLREASGKYARRADYLLVLPCICWHPILSNDIRSLYLRR
jgi:hypothetical protein